MVDGGNEQHLAKLMKTFNRNMYLSYLQKTHLLIKQSLSGSDYSSVEKIKNFDGVGELAFRITFNYPVYITLSHPICRFRSHRNYPVRERLFIANLGLVPVFFSSMNFMTVLKLWGVHAETFFNPANSPLSDTETRCWELPESSRPVDYSSMNFMRQNNSQPLEAGKTIADIFEKYFRLGFWSFPRKGFCPSTHFLHGRAAISCQVKISKSLYVIREIENTTKRFFLEGKSIEAVGVTLSGLAESKGNYFFANFPAFIDTEIANKLLEKENIQTSFINGIVAEVMVRGKPKLSLMTVVAEHGESYFDIIASLIGIVADKKYSSTGTIAEIGTIDQLREDVYNLYLDISRKLKVGTTISDKISNSFDIALKAMFPILVETEDQKVMMIHPLVWGFLKKWKLIEKNDDEMKEVLVHLLSIMYLPKTTGFSKMFLSDSAEFFREHGVNKYEFIRAVLRLVKDIRLCNTIRTTLESSFDDSESET